MPPSPEQQILDMRWCHHRCHHRLATSLWRMAYSVGNYSILSGRFLPAGTKTKFNRLFIHSMKAATGWWKPDLLSLIKIPDNFMGESSVAFHLHNINHMITSGVVWNIMLIGKTLLVSLNGCSGRSITQREENQKTDLYKMCQSPVPSMGKGAYCNLFATSGWCLVGSSRLPSDVERLKT